MTPSAITPAARGARRKPAAAASAASGQPQGRRPASTASARPSGHSTKVRRPSAPRAPRRVSGPLGGRGTQTAATATAPARARPRIRPSSQRTAGAPLLIRSAAFVRALPDHSLLDRIVRGRAWIPLIGVLLAGIVAMQVEVLKLNAGIGRSLVRGTALQSQNALLRAQVATLADDQRIETKAAQMGMVMPSPQSIKFLSLGTGAALQRALTSYHQTNAASFTPALTAAGVGANSSNSASSGTGATYATSVAPSTAATAAVAPTNTTSIGSSTGAVAP